MARLRPSSGRGRTPLYNRFFGEDAARIDAALCDRLSSLMRRLASLFLLVAAAAFGESGKPLVIVGRIDTPIHPAAANYLKRLIASAESEGAALVVLSLSTPGGLYSSTREMADGHPGVEGSDRHLSSRLRAPPAASAGFFLLVAGDVAAMAPGTNTGAAHPVGGEGQDLPKTLNEKAEQDARAFIRTSRPAARAQRREGRGRGRHRARPTRRPRRRRPA